MKSAGFALMCVGSLAAALVAVLEVHHIDPLLFAPCLVAAGIGVVMMRVANLRQARDPERIASDVAVLRESLAMACAELKALSTAETPSHRLPALIDQGVRHSLARFADARESIITVWGTQAYADIMSAFAAGERYLNRVWSAASDGYPDEAIAYLARSHGQLAQALSLLEGLEVKSAAASR